MLKIKVLAATIAVLSIGVGSAQGGSIKVSLPVRNISPIDGKQMFTSYCAQCHGRDGKGGGPAASGLKKTPADLTGMARNNRGRFPEAQVTAVLEAGDTSSGNQMPAWGPVFGRMTHLSSNDKELRILNLIRYLETIQAM